MASKMSAEDEIGGRLYTELLERKQPCTVKDLCQSIGMDSKNEQVIRSLATLCESQIVRKIHNETVVMYIATENIEKLEVSRSPEHLIRTKSLQSPTSLKMDGAVMGDHDQENLQRIIDVVKTNTSMKAHDIAKKCGIGQTAKDVNRCLYSLQQQGIIKKNESDKTWKFIKDIKVSRSSEPLTRSQSSSAHAQSFQGCDGTPLEDVQVSRSREPSTGFQSSSTHAQSFQGCDGTPLEDVQDYSPGESALRGISIVSSSSVPIQQHVTRSVSTVPVAINEAKNENLQHIINVVKSSPGLKASDIAKKCGIGQTASAVNRPLYFLKEHHILEVNVDKTWTCIKDIKEPDLTVLTAVFNTKMPAQKKSLSNSSDAEDSQKDCHKD